MQLRDLVDTDTFRPQYSADWGDYISFTEHMQRAADDKGVDLILVDTGDRIEGNGLYDASVPKGLYQYDIFAEQRNIDVMSTGNHELYRRYTIEYEHNTTVPNYNESYVASNLDYINLETREQMPAAQRYKRFTTKNQGFDIISMGFIFNFKVYADNSVVQPVEDLIKEEWFQEIVKEKPDLFLIIGHVGLRMNEFKTIFKAIRKVNWHSPIAFFGGHAHRRDAVSYGADSFAMASGRYLETIGWMSIDGLEKSSGSDSSAKMSTKSSPKFTRRYIDNNLFGMHYHTGLNNETFPTEHGRKVSGMITHARKALDLDYLYGCAPRDLWASKAPYGSEDNVYTWLAEEVFPGVVTREDRKDIPRIALMNNGGIRFDILKGPFTRDTAYTVSPFFSYFRYLPNVPWKVAKRLEGILNSSPRILGDAAIDFRSLGIPEQMHPPEFPANAEEEEAAEPRLELRSIQQPLTGSTSELPLIRGHTTKDDIGHDGDDTIHLDWKNFVQPNVIQGNINFPEDGEPETVDVVFIDFMQSAVLLALKLAGESYRGGDVRDYIDGTLTHHICEWIKQNWTGEC